jgi:excinuclease ABC subunit C
LTKEQFQSIASTIPHQPGVYKYFDETDTIIYVGKAKDLRKRVASYFSKDHADFKTRRLVYAIDRIEFTIVSTEQESLLLESSLIKHYQPRYNILLRDDKSYPHVVIKNEEFPRIFLTRKIIRDGSTYLGPFTSVWQVRDMLNVLRENLPIRTCDLPLTEATIQKGKYKECLQYHIGNCKAPCIGKQSKEDYNWYVQQIKEILKGKTSEIKKIYTKEMQAYAAAMQFEKAELIKQKLHYLEDYCAKSAIVHTSIDNVDVISYQAVGELDVVVNFLGVLNGTIVHSKTIVMRRQEQESDEDVVSYVYNEFREQFSSTATEVIAAMPLQVEANIACTQPKQGDKKKLLDLSQQNTSYFVHEILRQKTLMLKQKGTYEAQVLQEIKDALRLPRLPQHIECFDNSNFQGSFPVAAMVCFKNGMPYKKEYRHFHIKTVEGINDFASMTEIVGRRYARLLKEDKPLPDLVIIDGGKGQLSAALESIRNLGLLGKFTVVGLAKNVEEIFFPGDKESIRLPYHSEALKLITYIRDEVHRFGITFHRDVRSKGVVKTELHDIPSIGPSTANQLLKKFKSVKNIKQQSEVQLAAEIGAAKAKAIVKYFAEQGK